MTEKPEFCNWCEQYGKDCDGECVSECKEYLNEYMRESNVDRLQKDFSVVTIRREDLAYIIYFDCNNRMEMASKHSDEFMKLLATRMGEYYFNDEPTGSFREWVKYAWNIMQLDGEIEVV